MVATKIDPTIDRSVTSSATMLVSAPGVLVVTAAAVHTLAPPSVGSCQNTGQSLHTSYHRFNGRNAHLCPLLLAMVG